MGQQERSGPGGGGLQERWLYSSPEGKWFIMDEGAEAQSFDLEMGYIASAEPHNGAWSHNVTTWKRFDGRQFHVDDSIRISLTKEEKDEDIDQEVNPFLFNPNYN